jgi:hypothetical protein
MDAAVAFFHSGFNSKVFVIIFRLSDGSLPSSPSMYFALINWFCLRVTFSSLALPSPSTMTLGLAVYA